MPNYQKQLSPIPKSKTDEALSQIEINQKALQTNRLNFAKKGIVFCEFCNSGLFTSFAHRHKRRYYYDKDPQVNIDKLTDFNEVLLLCGRCHDRIEKSPSMTNTYFVLLRSTNMEDIADVFVALYMVSYQVRSSNFFVDRKEACEFGKLQENFIAVVPVQVSKDKLVIHREH